MLLVLLAGSTGAVTSVSPADLLEVICKQIVAFAVRAKI